MSSNSHFLKKIIFLHYYRDREWAESMKMGSFLSVANGSDEPPKFVELHYNGKPELKEHIAFVGKGITFDR